jgi:hypothetical protein
MKRWTVDIEMSWLWLPLIALIASDSSFCLILMRNQMMFCEEPPMIFGE